MKLIITLGLIALLLAGCGTKMTEKQYQGYRYEQGAEAKDHCDSKGLTYLMVDIPSFTSTIAICYTSSPFKLYHFEI